jgi:hypothetical protein
MTPLPFHIIFSPSLSSKDPKFGDRYSHIGRQQSGFCKRVFFVFTLGYQEIAQLKSGMNMGQLWAINNEGELRPLEVVGNPVVPPFR